MPGRNSSTYAYDRYLSRTAFGFLALFFCLCGILEFSQFSDVLTMHFVYDRPLRMGQIDDVRTDDQAVDLYAFTPLFWCGNFCHENPLCGGRSDF